MHCVIVYFNVIRMQTKKLKINGLGILFLFITKNVVIVHINKI